MMTFKQNSRIEGLLNEQTAQARGVHAQYKLSSLPLYMGNPLIEALEDYLTYSRRAISKLLAHKMPPCHPQANHKQRDNVLAAMTSDLFIPLPRHLGLQETVDLLIRSGYRKRCPQKSKEYIELLLNCGELSAEEERRLQEEDNLSSNYQDALSCAVIGNSGIGKTYAICRVLSLYPQLIVHDSIPGFSTFVQIVYLRVECPHDGSVKSLCAAIIAEIDRVTGENFTEIYVNKTRSTATVLKNRVSHLLMLYNVGLLVIDEIQNLLVSRMEREQLFNFIVSLSNTLNVPLLFIGTPKANQLMDKDLRIGRRFGSYGVMQWGRLEFNSPEWKEFITQLWKNSVLREEEPLIPEDIEQEFFACSQGITDILVKLFALSQKLALVNNKERLTKAIISKAFSSYFINVKPMLTAIKNNDIQALARYEDISMPEQDYQKASAELSKQLDENINKSDEISDSVNTVTMRVFRTLEAMEIPIDDAAAKLVTEIMSNNASLQVETSAVVKEFLQRWMPQTAPQTEQKPGAASSKNKQKGHPKAAGAQEQIAPSSAGGLEEI